MSETVYRHMIVVRRCHSSCCWWICPRLVPWQSTLSAHSHRFAIGGLLWENLVWFFFLYHLRWRPSTQQWRRQQSEGWKCPHPTW